MADAALFHDPVYDGATDPTVIRHRETGEWWMFATQRRASVDEPGVAWVHGSRDEWRGMGVFRSVDAVHWTRQGGPDHVILGEPGRRPGDQTFGRHGDVVVEGDTATFYYFTHPHWDGSEPGASAGSEARVNAIFSAPLVVVDGVLVCDRDAAAIRNRR